MGTVTFMKASLASICHLSKSVAVISHLETLKESLDRGILSVTIFSILLLLQTAYLLQGVKLA